MPANYTRMQDLARSGELAGRTLLIRQDLNVPVQDGRVTNDKRIRASLPTVELALDAGAAVILVSHLGRPVEGEPDEALSLLPVAECLGERLGRDVRLVPDWIEGVSVTPGEVVLGENVRFLAGEKANDDQLARKMADLCDVYVMDAFGTAHRAQASTHGVARFAPQACAGPLLSAELEALGKAVEDPARPVVAIVGGSKVSTKLSVLESLAGFVDQLIVGGGIANTFLAGAGHPVGKSLYEPDLLDAAARISGLFSGRGAAIPLPVDVVCATALEPDAVAIPRGVDEVGEDEMILDVGPRTAEQYDRLLAEAGTILWNGPVGVFEYDQFGEGTRRLAEAIAASPGFSVAGGGDTLAAVDKYGVAEQVSYISTGGGAFLEFLEGKTLPAVEVLMQRGASGG